MTTLGVGLMSGTSLDGIDAALVAIEHAHSAELVGFRLAPYTAADRHAISEAIERGNARTIAALDARLGEQFAFAALELLKQEGVSPQELSFVASHGQTIWHEPRKATLQVGSAAVIAERTGVQVVSDFRSRDVAAGGEGAPLVPIADVMLFGHPEHGRVLLNIGGMANVTWVPRLGQVEGVLGFDTGPGVAVLDAVTHAVDSEVLFDENGVRAARGTPCDGIVGTLLEHPYFAQAPPKSTGRETFGDVFAHDLLRRVRNDCQDDGDDDAVATALGLTVRSIAAQLARWIPGVTDGIDIVVSGGGVQNATLMDRLRAALVPSTVLLFEEVFFDGGAKEAVAFAYLGWLTLEGRSGNVPSATGASGLRVLGSVTPGG